MGTYTTCAYGDKGWSSSTTQSSKTIDLPSKMVRSLIIDSKFYGPLCDYYINGSNSNVESIVKEGETTVDREKCFKLGVTYKSGYKATVYLSTLDYMIRKVESPTGIFKYRNYKKTGQVMIPRYVEVTNNKGTITSVVSSIKINGKVKMICFLALSMLSAVPIQATADSVINNVNLREVVVTAHKIDDRGGKIVYNAYLEKVRTETSAVDLIRKVPMLSVDINGNVSIRGNSNVKILVNGHSCGILSSSQVLEQISPADILKVEVKTTPEVKYEAQGTGGVVNIITRKRMYFKSSGYLNTGMGIKGSHLMGNFNYAVDNHWSFQNSFYGLLGYSGTSGESDFSGHTVGKNTGQLYSLQTGASRSDDKSMLNLNLQYMYQNASYRESLESGEKIKRITDITI